MRSATRDARDYDGLEITFLDMTGDGLPDGVVARRVIELEPLVGRAGRVRGVVETTALDIGIDGIPKELRVRETVLGSTLVGADEVLSSVEFEVHPGDAEFVPATMAFFALT